jgi:ribosomal-protein-alanine N-acetyltransferase
MSESPAVVLEAATLDDLPALVALEARCHTHPWSERGLRDAIAPAAGQGGVLVLRAPSAAGNERRGIEAYCAFQVVADEAHIHNLAVIPEARRRGLARGLLARTLEIAAKRGARAAHLEVRAGNSAARALYRGMGFREVGTRPGYYSGPAEDAVLLTRADLARPSPANLERPPLKC